MTLTRHPFETPSSAASGGTVVRAFTLLELLVAIAVIAILSILVFPAASNALQLSSVSKCTTNLRQIGLAFQLYSADNEHKFPAANPATITGSKWGGLWYSPYEDGAEYSPAGYAGGLKKWKELTACPDNITPARTFNYSVNYNMMPPAGASDLTNLMAVVRPERIIVAADSSVNPQLWGAGLWGLNSGWLRLENRHTGKANILWADGHVSTVDLIEIKAENFK